MQPAPPTDRSRTRTARSDEGSRGPEESDPSRSSRMALRHWSLPVKLAAVLLVPTLFVVALGVLQIVQQTRRASAYDGVTEAVGLQARTTDLLGALSAERTAAATISGAPGAPTPDAAARLQVAAGATTRATAALVADGRGASAALDPTADTALDRVEAAAPTLDALRRDVPARAVDLAGVLARYGEVSTTVLRFSDALTRAASDPELLATSDALHQLAVVTDADGELRALVSGAIAAGRLDPALVGEANSALLRRQLAAGELRTALGGERSEAADTVSGPEQQARDDVVARVVSNPGSPPPVSAADWDRTAGAVTDRDAEVASSLRDGLAAEAASRQGAERTGAIVASVILLAALVAGAIVVWIVARSLLRPLRLLRRSALDVAERRLPAAVRSLREGEAPDTTIVPTPITTHEEIGQVARAFDQVHEQAVRLAAEQAGLRTAFNSIFVNLSRRSQALVERQLRLIEALENHEEDPEALSELFQLDHLATRMRRNSENLLVLAGTDLSRRNTRPVPLVDVLRSSASEVEQYQRVDLPAPIGVQILGRNADDLVHLVAELLENATTFSAPDTRVEVAATSGEDGSLTVEVCDRGVGMSEGDLTEANDRLADPPTVDVSASRRMGLFVVGRLAVRHGIAVTLRAREGGGLVAEAVVPASVVLPAAQPVPAPHEAARDDAGAVATVGAAPAERADAGPAGSASGLHRSGLPVRRPGEAGSRTGLGADGPDHADRNGHRVADGPDAVTDVFAAGRRNGHGAGPVPGEDPLDADESVRDDADDGAHDADDADDGYDDADDGYDDSYDDSDDSDDDDADDRTVATAVDLDADGGRTVWRRAEPDGDEGAGSADADAATDDTPPMGIPVPAAGGPSARPSPSPSPSPSPRPAAEDPVPADAGLGLPLPTRPTRRGDPPPESTPIFEEIASAWFREGMPTPGRITADQDDALWSSPAPDEGWQAAAQAAAVQDEEVTAAGLPRRRPRARLVPGGVHAAPAAAEPAAAAPAAATSATLATDPADPAEPSGPAGTPAPPAPRRDPEAVRGRWASYQRGVASGRSAHAARTARTVPDDAGTDAQEES